MNYDDNEPLNDQDTEFKHSPAETSVYAVTFRLNDSLPTETRLKLEQELEAYRTANYQDPSNLSIEEKRKFQYLRTEKVDEYLNSGIGECWLKQPEISEIIINEMHHYDKERYILHAWCVMPNHVHVILEPLIGNKLLSILRTWKSFTAQAANKILNRKGIFWLSEYYDHIIRDEFDYQIQLDYLWQNPEKADISAPRWKRDND